MKYFKKLNSFGRLLWAAKLENCTDKDAVEISEEEYLALTAGPIDPDDVLQCETVQ